MDRAPEELLPIMPPMVARLLVEVSGPKVSPVGARAATSSSLTMPGCTRAHPASASTSSTRFLYLEKSSTRARPTACPARLVPPPRGRRGTSLAGQAVGRALVLD